jgi:hypothetical protein
MKKFFGIVALVHLFSLLCIVLMVLNSEDDDGLHEKLDRRVIF